MRILKLRFKNLNSLYGEWVIDFTCPEFIREGIFLISGPTGGGKSTLLDAMCLALYGRTPRLNSISQSGNEIMSRQTGECFAEVEFETASGRFLAHWGQRRAYRKPDGNLVDSRHEISDAVSGEILASKKRETAVRIISETGMDFERFTRSMMLAQGGFAVFLQAAPDERAPILEQITGTEIYSSISKKVHERLAEEKDRLKQLEAHSGGIHVLEESEEADIKKELAEKQSKEEQDLSRQKELSRFIDWHNKIESLVKEAHGLEQSLETARNESAEFEPDQIRLKHAVKAAELDSAYATLSAARDQQKADIGLLYKIRKKRPGLEKEFKERQSALIEARKYLEKLQADQKVEQALIKQVRVKDQQIGQQKKDLAAFREESGLLESRLMREKKQLEAVMGELKEKEETLETISRYLSVHARDSEIPVLLVSIREKQDRLKEILGARSDGLDELAGLKTAHEKQVQQKKKQERRTRELEKDDKAVRSGIVRQEKAMAELLDGRSLKGYRTERDGLMREMAYRQTIARLEDERSKLVTGEPCPLCGAREHPFAAGHVPKPDKIQEKIDHLNQRIDALEDMENELKTLQDKGIESARQMEVSEKEQMRIQYELDRVSGEAARIEKAVDTMKLQADVLTESLNEALTSFDRKLENGKPVEEIFQTLEKRDREFKEKQAEENRIRKSAADNAALAKELKGKLEELENSLKQRRSAEDAREQELARVESERACIYGNRNPDAVEKEMALQMISAAEAESKAMKAAVEAEKELEALSERASELEQVVSGRSRSLAEMEASFSERLKVKGFENEQSFLDRRLPAAQREHLIKASQKLEQLLKSLSARLKDRQDLLAEMRKENLTRRTKQDLEKDHSDLLVKLREAGEQIGALKQRLSDNIEARKRLESQARKIDRQKKACARWGALHALIGSADGKKYRNFAQGITFELMISHANRQLEKMSDRYLLVRDGARPLELNVVDDYQAGEIRSTKNLSGGESFIVSLCLALGLSGMASRNIRVDSLFLDEGFGTLDEEALETALHALGTLHQSGKLVGLISHVPALKESINTQISITPISGGRSIISGPGCSSNDI